MYFATYNILLILTTNGLYASQSTLSLQHPAGVGAAACQVFDYHQQDQHDDVFMLQKHTRIKTHTPIHGGLA